MRTAEHAQSSMQSRAGRLCLFLLRRYYHNISFTKQLGGTFSTFFRGGEAAVRNTQSPNSRGRLSFNFCQPDPQRSAKKGGNQDRGSPRLEKKKEKRKRGGIMVVGEWLS